MTKTLKRSLAELSKIERRRLILYYEKGLTFKQIAEAENCKYPAVMKSVGKAKEKIKKYFEKQGYIFKV
jgi:DNA-directed RNA polymerase specialized sigma24 family protein